MSRAPIRNCDECKHFVPNQATKHAHCARGQKLRFTFPKLPGIQDPKSWGYRRQCELFQNIQPAKSNGPV
ncbi:MAG: hypothetical protein LLG20_22555 [Acidobacteriales bacterium]|nr:hypothetical protein [Terriglobales bacterium]